MNVRLTAPSEPIKCSIQLPISKSISNRALIVAALAGIDINPANLSAAEDTTRLKQLLAGSGPDYDCGAGGTTLRFLTAVLCLREGTHHVFGTERMHQRPIGRLVDALRVLGAEIEYTDRDGYPPIKIRGGALQSKNIAIDGSVSSQFVSALMLIGPMLPHGLQLDVEYPVSLPYIRMTAQVMQQAGASVDMTRHSISVQAGGYGTGTIRPEPDWSAASYWYSIALLAPTGSEIHLDGLSLGETIQGDAAVTEVFTRLGVQTLSGDTGIQPRRFGALDPLKVQLGINLERTPDVAQTVAVAMAATQCFGLLSGLKTLRIKETDRIRALEAEINRLGGDAVAYSEALQVNHAELQVADGHVVQTYSDHRMAMAFAPLALHLGWIEIENAAVVNKSYPGFWEDLKSAGFGVEFVEVS